MKAYFFKLFKFDQWANTKVVSAVSEANIREAEIVRLFSHIINAEYIWLGRITGNQELHRELWGVYKAEEFEREAHQASFLWLSFLESLEESRIGQQITYRNTKGDTFTTSLEDIMAHVVNHGTHHRAQISKLLRQHHVAPPNIDYIQFVRENQGNL